MRSSDKVNPLCAVWLKLTRNCINWLIVESQKTDLGLGFGVDVMVLQPIANLGPWMCTLCGNQWAEFWSVVYVRFIYESLSVRIAYKVMIAALNVKQ